MIFASWLKDLSEGRENLRGKKLETNANRRRAIPIKAKLQGALQTASVASAALL